jgi:hypothetical protein
MSDAYYRERAARRTRIMWLVIGIAVTVVCLVFSVNRVFWDECTQSFNRSPEAIVRSYVEAIAEGNAEQPRRCWWDDAYFDLESGCSEICIDRILGAPYEIVAVEVGEQSITESNRAKHEVNITISCGPGGEQHSGIILLDSISQNVPWQHWKILQSELGGPLAEPWCR